MYHLIIILGLLSFIEQVILNRGYCVIVVAEGAGSDLVSAANTETDESGNKKLPEIGNNIFCIKCII